MSDSLMTGRGGSWTAAMGAVLKRLETLCKSRMGMREGDRKIRGRNMAEDSW